MCGGLWRKFVDECTPQSQSVTLGIVFVISGGKFSQGGAVAGVTGELFCECLVTSHRSTELDQGCRGRHAEWVTLKLGFSWYLGQTTARLLTAVSRVLYLCVCKEAFRSVIFVKTK